MYLSLKQHDLFRTLLMGFEIPFRSYIADVLISNYPSFTLFETAMVGKKDSLQPTDPDFLKSTLPNACRNLSEMYSKFGAAHNPSELVANDTDIPMVGGLNIITFALTNQFQDLYNLFHGYTDYCILAEKYRYARNKLDHPGSRTLEESHLTPVLSFVQVVCSFLDEKYFVQKGKNDLLNEVIILQKRKTIIPIPIHNFSEMPITDTVIVCRDIEINKVKNFVYGTVGALRKHHSLSIYGYGGVGKTALVLECLKGIVADLLDGTTTNDYKPQYILFFSAKKRMLTVASETGKIIEKKLATQFEDCDGLKELILLKLNIESLKSYNKPGIIVIDNLESLNTEEKEKVKDFIDTQTPAEMQFIITSRNSEEYDLNYKLSVFSSLENGTEFVQKYSEENNLELELNNTEIQELLSLSKGNTLVLVLCLRRMSHNLLSLNDIKIDFTKSDMWSSIKQSLSQVPPNAFEIISQFMYKDTFEQLEKYYTENKNVFYKVLRVIAVSQNDGLDLSTLCVMTRESYPQIENVVDLLCNYLILEKQGAYYIIIIHNLS